MQHSLEAYFLMNFAMDAALIMIVARANECLCLRRILLSALLSASYAILAGTVCSRLSHPAIQLLLLCIISMILCGDPAFSNWSSICIQLTGCTLMIGGAAGLSPLTNHVFRLVIGTGFLLAAAMLNIRKRKILSWEVTVLICLKGKCVSFQTLIDTGNRLHEPLSGLPVLIAEAALLDKLPTSGLLFRRVSYGALSGSGTIKCFRPDAVLICRGNSFFRAPDVWIAAYPGRIPGSAHALAPSVFASIPRNNLTTIP